MGNETIPASSMGMSTPNPFVQPGVTPGTTPATLPGATGQPQTPDAIQQILKQILAGAQQKPQIAGGVPAPVPPAPPQHQAAMGKYSGPANLGSAIGTLVQGVAHYDKAKKLAAATSDWNDVLVSTQKYIGPDGKVDPKAFQDPAVMQVLGDPKKLKRMAKALNQDWLNPKPDEYADGLKAALKQHTDKQQAMTGLKGTIQQMIQHIKGGGQPQGQVSPQGAASIMSRAPIGVPPQDPALAKDATSVLLEQMKEQSRATQDAQRDAYNMARDEFKAKVQDFHETQRENFQTNLQSMRDLSAERRQATRDADMLKALGIKLSAKDKEMVGGMTPAQVNAELNSSLTSMRQQLNQASQQIKTLQSHADKLTSLRAAHPIMGPGGEEVDEAKTELESARATQKSLQQAISFIESKRGAIVSGKMDMDSVIDQAQKIMTGDLSDLGGKPVQ